jgi:hypothetical protein
MRTLGDQLLLLLRLTCRERFQVVADVSVQCQIGVVVGHRGSYPGFPNRVLNPRFDYAAERQALRFWPIFESIATLSIRIHGKKRIVMPLGAVSTRLVATQRTIRSQLARRSFVS